MFHLRGANVKFCRQFCDNVHIWFPFLFVFVLVFFLRIARAQPHARRAVNCRCPQALVLQHPLYLLRLFTLFELGIDEIVKVAVQNGIDVRGFRAGPVILDHRVRLQDIGTDL